MALSFEKLKKLEEDSGYQKDSKFKRMFSSHPDLDKRIKVMSERATKDGFARPENKMPEQPVVNLGNNALLCGSICRSVSH